MSCKANTGYHLWGRSDGESGSVLRPGQLGYSSAFYIQTGLSGNQGSGWGNGDGVETLTVHSTDSPMSH